MNVHSNIPFSLENLDKLNLEDLTFTTAPLSTQIDGEKVKKMKIGTMIQIGMINVDTATEMFPDIEELGDEKFMDFFDNMHWLVKEKEFKYGPGKKLSVSLMVGKTLLMQNP